MFWVHEIIFFFHYAVGVSHTGGWIQGVTTQSLALKKQAVIYLYLNI